MGAQKLHIGLLLDRPHLLAWEHDAVRRLLDTSAADLTLVITLDYQPARDHRPGNIFRFLNRIDQKVFVPRVDALAPQPDSRLLDGVPTIHATVIASEAGTSLHPETVERIANMKLDILVQFGSFHLGTAILSAAKYGLWTYRFGDHPAGVGCPPGFWEVAEGQPDAGLMLVRRGYPSQVDQVLYRSRVFSHPFSPARNQNVMLWAAAPFLARQVTLLQRLGEEAFYRHIAPLQTGLTPQDPRPIPTVWQTLRVYSRALLGILREQYMRKSHVDTWFLMVDLSGDPSVAPRDFQTLMPPSDRFWADPQIVSRDGKYYIFIEELPYETMRGHLAVIEMDEQGNCSDSVPVMKKDYHLSYPFVFLYDGRYYMIPESAANKTIDLYECETFPYRWKFVMHLMENVRARDTTLYFADGTWWMFTGIAESEGASHELELFLFSASSPLTSQWKPHPLNPVVSDVTRARPAGRLFMRDGKLFRPSQDCSKIYGYSYNLNEVTCLTQTDYQEEKVVTVRPDWDPHVLATHTYATDGRLTVIDAFKRRRKRSLR